MLCLCFQSYSFSLSVSSCGLSPALPPAGTSRILRINTNGCLNLCTFYTWWAQASGISRDRLRLVQYMGCPWQKRHGQEEEEEEEVKRQTSGVVEAYVADDDTALTGSKKKNLCSLFAFYLAVYIVLSVLSFSSTSLYHRLLGPFELAQPAAFAFSVSFLRSKCRSIGPH